MAYRATEKTRAKAAERRELILRAAGRIVATDGWAAVTVARVAEEAGVSNGNVYTHFAEGFVDGTGTLHPVFEERMRHLASRPGWFVPMTTVLDRLRSAQAGRPAPGYPYLLRVDARWALERVEKLVRFRR